MSLPAAAMASWPAELRESYNRQQHAARVEAELRMCAGEWDDPRITAYLREICRQRIQREKRSLAKAQEAAGVSRSTVSRWRELPGFLQAETNCEEGAPLSARERLPRPRREGYLRAKPAPPLDFWAKT